MACGLGFLVSGPKSHLCDMLSSSENELQLLLDWFSQNKPKIEASRTKVIVNGSWAILESTLQARIRLGDTAVTEIAVVKDQGWVIGRHLTFVPAPYWPTDDEMYRHSRWTSSCLSRRHPCSFKADSYGFGHVDTKRCIYIYGTCCVPHLHRAQIAADISARVNSSRREHEHIRQNVRRFSLGFSLLANVSNTGCHVSQDVHSAGVNLRPYGL